jgi:hypothetical protein
MVFLVEVYLWRKCLDECRPRSVRQKRAREKQIFGCRPAAWPAVEIFGTQLTGSAL